MTEKYFRKLGLIVVVIEVLWGISHGWGSNFRWFRQTTPDWGVDTNWIGDLASFSVPSSTSIAVFGNTPAPNFIGPSDFSNEPTVTGGTSIGQLIFSPYANGTFAFDITFNASQTIGPSAGGTMIANNTPGVLQTITFNSDSLYGSVTGNVAYTLLNFTGAGSSTSTWFSVGEPSINARLNITTDTDVLKFKNAESTPKTITVNGYFTGEGDVHLEGTSSGTLKVIFADTENAQSGATYNGAVVVNSNTTAEGTAANIPSVNLAGGTLAFTDSSGTANYGKALFVTGASTITASSGATSVTLQALTTINSGGSLSLPSNNRIKFNAPSGMTALDLKSGGTFDLSSVDITGGSQTISTSKISAASGSIIKVRVNGAYSTVIDLKINNGFSLDGVTLEIVGTAPSGTTEYDLFTNVAEGTMSGTPTLTTTLPNITPTIGALTGTTVKLILTRPTPPSSAPSIPNGQTAAGGANVVAGTSQTASVIIGRGVLSPAREGDMQEPSYSPSFTTHPLKAPNLTGDFLNVTDGGLAHTSQDTTKRWSPARTERAGVWFQPFGRVNRQVANGGSPGSNGRTAGLLAGFDYKSRYDLIWGAALGYASTRESYDANSGKTQIKDRFLTVFGTWFQEPWYVEAGLLMGLEKYQGTRNTGPTNNNIFVSNHHGGYQVSPNLGGGYTFKVKESKLKTYATFNYTYAAQYGYQEQGVGGNYFKQTSASMLRSEVGANLSKVYEGNGFKWRPGFTLGIVNKKPIKKGTIVSASGASFESTTVTTTSISPGLESSIHFDDGYALSASWIGEYCRQYTIQEAFIKFTKKF